jgi:hypothetical protein
MTLCQILLPSHLAKASSNKTRLSNQKATCHDEKQATQSINLLVSANWIAITAI